jgi:hypothetical protein
MISIIHIACSNQRAPVTFEGQLSDDRHFYFESRWSEWVFGIGGTVDSAIEVSMRLIPDGFARSGVWSGGAASASYMPHVDAIGVIERCVHEYAAVQEQEHGCRTDR